jgi:hypothetical protein
LHLLNKYGSITVRLRRSIDAVDEPVMNRKYTERVRFVMAKIKRVKAPRRMSKLELNQERRGAR